MTRMLYKFTLTAKGGRHDGERQQVVLVGSGILERWLAMSQDTDAEIDMQIKPIRPGKEKT